MEHRNGSQPPQVVSQATFEALNLLAERFALLADTAMQHLRGEIAPGSPSFAPQHIADALDQLCDALDQFRDINGVAIPDLDGDTEPAG